MKDQREPTVQQGEIIRTGRNPGAILWCRWVEASALGPLLAVIVYAVIALGMALPAGWFFSWVNTLLHFLVLRDPGGANFGQLATGIQLIAVLPYLVLCGWAAGTLVGAMQKAVLGDLLADPKRWIKATRNGWAIGAVLGAVVYVIVVYVILLTSEPRGGYSMEGGTAVLIALVLAGFVGPPAGLALSNILASVKQASLIASEPHRGKSWVVWNTVAWVAAVLVAGFVAIVIGWAVLRLRPRSMGDHFLWELLQMWSLVLVPLLFLLLPGAVAGSISGIGLLRLVRARMASVPQAGPIPLNFAAASVGVIALGTCLVLSLVALRDRTPPYLRSTPLAATETTPPSLQAPTQTPWVTRVVPSTTSLPTETASVPPIPPLPVGQLITLSSINMFTDCAGWATGGIGGASDHILRTYDGGSTWEDATPPEPASTEASGAKIAFAHFSDISSAWVTYFLPSPSGGNPSVVWLTWGGGQWWASSPLPCIDPSCTNEGPLDIVSAHSVHGWITLELGASMDHRYVALYRTVDGGKTWERIIDPGSPNSADLHTCCQSGMAFADDQNGLVTFSQGPRTAVVVDWTYDGGSTWQSQQLPPPVQPPDRFTFNGTVCGTFSPVLFSSSSAAISTRRALTTKA